MSSKKKKRDLSNYGIEKELVLALSEDECEELYDAVDKLEEDRDDQFHTVRRRFRIAVLLLLVLIIVLSWRVGTPEPVVVLEPDYAMVDIEPNRIPMADMGGEKLEASQNGGAVAISYSDNVIYDQGSEQLTLSYGNPYASTQSVILQVIVFGPDGSEYLVAESGVIPPGYRVETLDVTANESVSVSAGVYNGIFRLLFYNAETGERAIVNTEIPIKLIVQ